MISDVADTQSPATHATIPLSAAGQCEQDQGTVIYEKITGQIVRTARESVYQLDTSPGGLSEVSASHQVDINVPLKQIYSQRWMCGWVE